MKKQLIWLVTLICCGVGVIAHAQEHLSVVLSTPESQAQADSAKVVVKITNDGDQPVAILKYKTPNWGSGLIAGNLFTVSDEAGKPVKYVGGYEDPGRVTDDMFYTIAPGQSKSTTVNLRNYYQVAGGVYRVVFNLRLGERPGGRPMKRVGGVLVEDSDAFHTVVSNALDIKVVSGLAKSDLN